MVIFVPTIDRWPWEFRPYKPYEGIESPNKALLQWGWQKAVGGGIRFRNYCSLVNVNNISSRFTSKKKKTDIPFILRMQTDYLVFCHSKWFVFYEHQQYYRYYIDIVSKPKIIRRCSLSLESQDTYRSFRGLAWEGHLRTCISQNCIMRFQVSQCPCDTSHDKV